MASTKPYIVIRIDSLNACSVVYTSDSIKDVKYWLQYIAQPNDAIFQTPAHPKYNGTGEPTYQAHLVGRGKIGYDEKKWRETAVPQGTELQIPEFEWKG